MGLVRTLSVLRGECAEEVCLVCGWSIDTGSGWGGKGVGEEESIGEEKACEFLDQYPSCRVFYCIN